MTEYSEKVSLLERILLLEETNVRLNKELWRLRKRSSVNVGFLLIAVSAFAAFLAFRYSSVSLEIAAVLAFFLGFFLVFYETEEKISTSTANAVLSSTIYPLQTILEQMEAKDEAFYIPPGGALKEGRVLIPLEESENIKWSDFKEFLPEKLVISSKGLSMIPLGYGLYARMAMELGLEYQDVDLEELTYKLPIILTDVFEFADKLRMWQDGNFIHLYLEKPKIMLEKDGAKPGSLYQTIEHPICSAIALSIAKVTGCVIRTTEARHDKTLSMIEVTFEIGEKPRLENIIST